MADTKRKKAANTISNVPVHVCIALYPDGKCFEAELLKDFIKLPSEKVELIYTTV